MAPKEQKSKEAKAMAAANSSKGKKKKWSKGKLKEKVRQCCSREAEAGRSHGVPGYLPAADALVWVPQSRTAHGGMAASPRLCASNRPASTRP